MAVRWHHVPCDDVTIVVRDEGEGEALVLVHGLLCTQEMFHRQVAGLRDRYRVVTYDVRGHGRSGYAPGTSTFPTLVADHLRVLDALGIDRAVQGGFSLGGMVTMRAVLAAPERFGGLALLNTTAGLDTDRVVRARFEAMAAAVPWIGIPRWLRREGSAGMFSGGFRRRDPEETRRWEAGFGGMDPRAVRDMTRCVARRDDVLEKLTAVRCPTLVLAGDRDPLTPKSCSRRMAERIATSELVVVADSGHGSPLERPDEVNAALVRLMERATSGG